TNSLTAIIAPVAATQLFSFFTSEAAPVYFPGAPFFAAGLMVAGSALLFIFAALRFNIWQLPEEKAEKPLVPPPLPSGQAVNRPYTDDEQEDDENGEEDGEKDSRP